MRGIILIDAIKLFGFKEAIGFWFKWSFIDPVEMFLWRNVIHKPWCEQHGYHCPKNCEYPKHTSKKEILKAWKEMEDELLWMKKEKRIY